MALDQVILNPGAGGDSIGTDKILGVDYELVKQAFGVEGSITMVSLANPLPVNTGLSQPLTDTQLRAADVKITLDGEIVPVTGAFFQAVQPVSAAALPLPTGASTEATLSTLNGKVPSGLTVTANRLQVELPSGGTGLTDTELRATPVPVTANAGTNLNTSALALEAGNLASIKAKTDNIPAQGQALAAASLPVVLTALQVTTLTPPSNTGYATSAKQDILLTELQLKADLTETQPVSLASVPSHPVTNAGTFAVQATLAANDGVDIGDVTVNNAVGSPANVKIGDGTLTATVRDTGTNDSLNVAIVDASGNQITSFGGGTQYTEDVASAADPVGNLLLARRRDTPASETTTDGDNTALNSTAKGELYVKHIDSIPVTDNGGSLTVDGTFWQGTQPVSATDLDIRNLVFATDKVDASGTILGASTNNIGDVDVLTMPAVTNAGTFVVQENGAALTALQLIDDTVFTDDTSTHATGTTKGLGIMAVANPTDAAVDANDIGMVAMTLARAMKNDITTIAGTAPTTVGKLDVKGADGDVFVRQATASNLNAAVVGTGTAGTPAGNILTIQGVAAMTKLLVTPDSVALPANQSVNVAQMGGVATSMNTGVRDTGTQRVTIATNDVVPITDNSGSLTVDAPVGTPVNVQIGNATLSAGVIDETGASAVDALAIGGGTAHGAVDSGNPIKVGGVAVSGSASPTAVASGDRTRFISNRHGIPYSISGHPNLITREYDFGTAAQTDLNLAAAAVAATERIYITRFEALCDNANTVAVSVRAGFGTASVPAASATGVSGMIASHPGIAAGSGILCGNGSGIIAVGGAGEEPRLTSSAATTGNLHVIISYFLIDEA